MNIYEEIVERFGIENQTRQAMEECAELIQALNKILRMPTFASRQALITEMADVQIVMEEMRLAWSISRLDLQEEHERKLNRMRKHLKKD